MKMHAFQRIMCLFAIVGAAFTVFEPTCEARAASPAIANETGAKPRTATFAMALHNRTVSSGTAFDIASGDFTGTHVKDIVIANGAGGSVSLLAGRGDGTFATAATVYSSPGKSVTAITTGDFNSDGHLDIAIVREGTLNQDLVLLLGDGHRHFHQSASAPLRDLGQMGPIIFGGVRSLAVGALTHNRVLDFVVSDGVNYVSVFSGNGLGGIRSRQDLVFAAIPSSLIVANLYGAGPSDIGGVDRDSTSLYTITNRGDGTFGARRRIPIGQLPINAQPVSLSGGDLRHLGRTDLFVVDSSVPMSGNVVGKLVFSNGDGSYSRAIDVPIRGLVAFPWAGAIADFNLDGNLDLAVVAENFPNQNDVIVLPGNGHGTFSTAAETFIDIMHGNVILIPDKIDVDDFNGDGKPDIAIAFDRTKGMGVDVLLNTTP